MPTTMAAAALENGKGKKLSELRGALATVTTISSERGLGYCEEKGTSQTERVRSAFNEPAMKTAL